MSFDNSQKLLLDICYIFLIALRIFFVFDLKLFYYFLKFI